jgi:hypothetical protein
MTMTTPTKVAIESNRAWLMFLLAAAVQVSVVAVFEWKSAPIRAETTRLLALELAAESEAFCEKQGIPSTASNHQNCLSGVRTIRDSHSARINRDNGYGL